MMKNRTGLVALLVLAVAAVVMIFFVLPGRKEVGELAEKGAQSVAETAEKVEEKAKDAAGEAASKADRVKEALSSPEVMEKVGRLKADAEAAAASLQALFSDGRIPGEAELAEAKAKTEAALKAIADFKAPEGADAAVGDTVSALRASAQSALEKVRSIPEDAKGAASVIAGLKGFFGKPGDMQTSETDEPESDVTAGIAPTFDILRVEKDGSTVIAGKGEPGSMLELVDGEDVIAKQQIDKTGDFAIVLDEPLKTGDHQLMLRTKGEGEEVTVSQEVATVAVPEDENGELLAMVSKPGEASRILTMPEADDAKPAETAQAAEPSAVTSEETTEAASGSETAMAENVEPADEGETAADSAPSGETSAEVKPSTEVPAQPAEIRVTAVELEGDRIYVAGQSKPGAELKVYADDKLIDDTTADQAGHFVAEGKAALDVGNHIIRADVVESGSGKVVVRVSVPFNRPEGERVSVAANTPGSQPADTAPASDGGASAQLTQLREEATKAMILLKGLFADGKTPAPDALAAARSATQIALNALAAFKPGPDADEKTADLATKAAASATSALKVLEATGPEPADVFSALPDIETAAADAVAPVEANIVSEGKVSENQGQDEPGATAESGAEVAEVSTGMDEPKTIEQSPLESDKNSVIIRRGDTLWQISRRLYGKGVRYTTIYLANQQEITNPNMINPGQVFKVPEEMLEDDYKAEETNRKLQSQ